MCVRTHKGHFKQLLWHTCITRLQFQGNRTIIANILAHFLGMWHAKCWHVTELFGKWKGWCFWNHAYVAIILATHEVAHCTRCSSDLDGVCSIFNNRSMHNVFSLGDFNAAGDIWLSSLFIELLNYTQKILSSFLKFWHASWIRQVRFCYQLFYRRTAKNYALFLFPIHLK